MTEKEVIELIKKYQDGTCTEEERAKLEMGYIRYLDKQANMPFPKDLWARKEAGLKYILEGGPSAEGKTIPFFKKYQLLAIAASIALCFSAGLYFYQKNNIYSASTQRMAQNKIAPGKNAAILTLADGKRIVLTDAANRTLAKEAGIQISKTADGQLIYAAIPAESSKETNSDPTRVLYNTVETPKGGQYQVYLPDGTKVWLNAGTILKYPVRFISKGARKIELSGEAYFEVAKDKMHPFIVQSMNQEVQVLGTHFNINCYVDEPSTKTTLIEGSVKVHSSIADKILKPGQQSIGHGQNLTVGAVNLDEVLAWKKGYFNFYNEDIHGIMRKISRWYDVDVVYQGDMRNEGYNGAISRYKDIGQILKMLESTGTVHFKVQGRRVLVMQ